MAAEVNAPQLAVSSQKAPVRFLGVEMPESIAGGVRSFRATTSRMRKWTVKTFPAFIVNNSSNILGLAHVGTEMLMFKSGMPQGEKLIQNPKNPINWVYEPLKTVFQGVAKGAQPKDLNLKELFQGNPIKNISTRAMDMKDATVREKARMKAEYRKTEAYKNTGIDLAEKDMKLANRWQMRSTFMGLVIWSLSALIPEKKETSEEVERMAIMRANHPIKYIGERLKQGLYFPEWNKHKRQMLGLGYIAIGISSMLGSWRGRDINKVTKEMEYSFNSGYFMTSALSLASAFPLMFATDEKSGYSGFGSIMMGRIPFLYKSIKNKYRSGGSVDGARDYTTASILFQAENIMQSLIGGAQKIKKTLPDGTVVEEIVDHNEVRQEAKVKAKLEQIEKITSQGSADEVLAQEANGTELVAKKQASEVFADAEKETVAPATAGKHVAAEKHEHVAKDQPHVQHPTKAHADHAEQSADVHEAAAKAPGHNHHDQTHAAKIEHHASTEHHIKPVTKVTPEREVSHAMPERVEAHQQQLATVAAPAA